MTVKNCSGFKMIPVKPCNLKVYIENLNTLIFLKSSNIIKYLLYFILFNYLYADMKEE